MCSLFEQDSGFLWWAQLGEMKEMEDKRGSADWRREMAGGPPITGVVMVGCYGNTCWGATSVEVITKIVNVFIYNGDIRRYEWKRDQN